MGKVIIIGGGASVGEGIALGLWDKLRGQELWSCNSVYKAMPYLPQKQIWVDTEFFKYDVENLQRLHSQGVHLVTKKHIRVAPFLEDITQYESTRETQHYYGKKAIERDIIYYGRMGLCGMFGLSFAIAAGYTEIYLLGYDFGAPTVHHRHTHWYQNVMGELKIMSSGAGRPEVYLHKEPEAVNQIREEVVDFEVYAKEEGVKIYNVSMISHIPYFPKISYEDFFKQIGV